MPKNDYQSPVAALLTYGECRSLAAWPNYVEELGFQETDIPELIRMATDKDLNKADSKSLEVWAPTHAWRALGQLTDHAAVPPLLTLLNDQFDDWAHTEIPAVVAMIGPSALPAIERFLADSNNDCYGRISAVTCITQLNTRHPEPRERYIDILTQQLAKFEENDPELNGFLINGLCDLNAIEKAPDIERAFAAERVDFTIVGDWDEVQVLLGLKERSEVPRKRFVPTEMFGPLSKLLGALTHTEDPLSSIKRAKKRSAPQGFGAQSKERKDTKAKKKRG
jgi:hypothetical protein